MTEEPASLILELLRQMRAELGDAGALDMATKADLSLVSEPMSPPICTRYEPMSPPIS